MLWVTRDRTLPGVESTAEPLKEGKRGGRPFQPPRSMGPHSGPEEGTPGAADSCPWREIQLSKSAKPPLSRVAGLLKKLTAPHGR